MSAYILEGKQGFATSFMSPTHLPPHPTSLCKLSEDQALLYRQLVRQKRPPTYQILTLAK